MLAIAGDGTASIARRPRSASTRPSPLNRESARPRVVVGKKQQPMVGEPAQVARFIHAAGIHADNFRRLFQAVAPCVDVILVFGDVVARGRRQHDVQIVDAAERRHKRPKRRDDATVARQEAEDVGVEAEAPHARDRRRRKACGAEQDQRATAPRPRQNAGNW